MERRIVGAERTKEDGDLDNARGVGVGLWGIL